MIGNYPGGKGLIYHHLVNQTTPHMVLIVGCAGGGSFFNNIKRAPYSLLFDLDERVIRAWSEHLRREGYYSLPSHLTVPISPKLLAETVNIDGGAEFQTPLPFPAGTVTNDRPSVKQTFVNDCGQRVDLYHMSILDWLDGAELSPYCFVYLDPPYLIETRRNKRRRYRNEFTVEDHERLLKQVQKLNCNVMLSGYHSRMYDDALPEWQVMTIDTYIRGGIPATEYVWMNYAEPNQLHDYQHVGHHGDYRANIKRRNARWLRRIGKMRVFERLSYFEQLSHYFEVKLRGQIYDGGLRNEIVLSLFPGLDLLGRGFESEGYIILRGPDPLWGGDIRQFTMPPGRVEGIIAGSPCQDFSGARRDAPTGLGLEMLGEFVRLVLEAQPDWWLLENVPAVPDVRIPGYNHQRLDVRATDFGLSQRRLRHFQWGSRSNEELVLPRLDLTGGEATVTSRLGGRSWSAVLQAQGLPPDLDLPFRLADRNQLIANGVPLPMAKAFAQAVRNRVPAGTVPLCQCSCGRPLPEKRRRDKQFASARCRMKDKKDRELRQM